MGRHVRACVCKHLYIRVVQGHFPHFFGITSLWLQPKVKLILTIILQKYLITFNDVTVNLHYMCIHLSMHLCLCVRVCICEMCLHASVHIIICSATVRGSSYFRLVRPWSRSSILAKGEGGSGRTPGSVRSTQYTRRRKILGVSPRIYLEILGPLILITSV